jgi:acetoin utilization protein AcuB
VYIVSPDAPIGEVASAMAEHKYGCAVVMNGTHLAGIFTTTDALRALITLAQSPVS